MRRRAFIATTAAWATASAQDWRHSEAFQKLYNLDFDGAIPLLEKDIARQPGEPDHYNNLAYAILYRALFAADALDGGVALSVSDFLHRPKVPFQPADRDRFNKTLQQSEAAARARGERADAIYALGVSQTHRANLALLVDKEWRSALKTGGEARKLHARALELDKNFVDAMLVPSFHEYIIGSLPIYLKALGFLVGFTGDKDKGIQGLQTVAKYGQRAKLEAQVLLALVENREEHPERAVEVMRNLVKEFPTNHLYRKEVTSLLLAAKRKDEARREFAELSHERYRFLKPTRLEAYKKEFEAKLRA
jgi:hypothetical protein